MGAPTDWDWSARSHARALARARQRRADRIEGRSAARDAWVPARAPAQRRREKKKALTVAASPRIVPRRASGARVPCAPSRWLMGHSLQGMKQPRGKKSVGRGRARGPRRANGAERAWRRARRAGAGGGRFGARPNAEREPRDRRRGGARARRAMFRRGGGAKSGHDGARRATEQAPRVELAERAGSAAESAAEAPTPGGGAAGSASRSMVCVGVLRAGRPTAPARRALVDAQCCGARRLTRRPTR